MSYLRKDFLDILNIARPALASKDLVEELVCFWFVNDKVYAYNDVIGIQLPLKTDFTGGIRGSLILGLLDKSRAKDIFIEPINDGEMLLRAANTRLTMPLFEDKRSLWDVPE